MYKNKRIRYVSCEEMSSLLDSFGNKRFKLGEPTRGVGKRDLYIIDKEVEFRIIVNTSEGDTEYVTRKDETRKDQVLNGGEAYRIMSRYYKVPQMPESVCGKGTLGGHSARPITYANPVYDGTRNKAIGYDLNSAYGAALKKPMPDTSVAPRTGEVGEGEVGFVLDKKEGLKAVFSGFATRIFPLMPSPFTRFVTVWYERKRKAAPGSPERAKAKQVLNLAIGQLQNHNPYIRAMVVTYCNDFIRSLIDENTLFANTDSIVSLVKRPDIEEHLGDGCGEWKIEHEGDFAYIGNGRYQWNLDEPSWKGVSKCQFCDHFDLLKDDLYSRDSVLTWRFNSITLRFERV